MCHCQIQCNFGGIDDLCKLRKKIFNCTDTANYALHSRQNSETFDILHAFPSSVIAKLCDLKNSLVFLAHPVGMNLTTTIGRRR